MRILAKSVMAKHAGMFAYFGHSMLEHVENLAKIMETTAPPGEESRAPFQLVFFGGCSSFSVYPDALFAAKASLNPDEDPLGDQNLAVVANGLESYPNWAEDESLALFNAAFFWEDQVSYHDLLNKLESKANPRFRHSVPPGSLLSVQGVLNGQ